MNPSEAKVFSSGISGFLSSKKRGDVSYSRLDEMDDSVEFSKVHFDKDRTSFCTKLCFGLLALMLLLASVGSAIFIMNLKHFTVEVTLKQGNIRVYRFDQELTIVGREITTRNVSIVVTTHVINRTKSDCWFGLVLSFPRDTKQLISPKDFAFLTHVTSAGIEDGARMRFKVFGNRKTGNELSFYVHNILRQLFPIIKVKLYEFVLSKMTSTSTHIAMEKQGFLPGRVHLKRTMITKDNIVTVMTKASPDDFESFSYKNGESPVASWKLEYDETTVVNKKTGMLKRSDMSLLGSLPVGADFGSPHAHNQGLTVRFKSVVKQLDESRVKAKHWKNEVKEESDISHPLNFPGPVEKYSLVYFAPPKSKHTKKPSEELEEIIRLSENSPGRSTKLPPFIKFVRHEIPKSDVMKSDSVDSEDDDDDDYANNEDMGDDGDNDGDNDVDTDDQEDRNDNADDDNQPSWPMQNFSPFGLGYEVRRKRSLGTKRLQMTKSKKAARQRKEKTPDLDIIWDDLMSSAPLRNHEVPRVIQTSILGLDFRAEVEYEVHVDDDDDDNDDDDDDTDDDDNNGRYDNDDNVRWDIIAAFRVTIGQYRITPFRRVHTLGKIRSRLPPKGQQRSSRWTVKAGDFVSTY